MIIQLNGEERQLHSPLTLWDLLTTEAIPIQSIAVAVNDEIVPRSEFERRQVNNQDRVEIIHAVGGG